MRRFCADACKPLTCGNVTNRHSQTSSSTSSFPLEVRST